MAGPTTAERGERQRIAGPAPPARRSAAAPGCPARVAGPGAARWLVLLGAAARLAALRLVLAAGGRSRRPAPRC